MTGSKDSCKTSTDNSINSSIKTSNFGTNTETCDANSDNTPKPFENPIDDVVLENTASIMAAMADTARLSILLILDEGKELCVSELAEILDDKVNTISMRLKKLYEAGLVSKRREAKHIYYRLSDEHVVTIIHNAIEHTKYIH